MKLLFQFTSAAQPGKAKAQTAEELTVHRSDTHH